MLSPDQVALLTRVADAGGIYAGRAQELLEQAGVRQPPQNPALDYARQELVRLALAGGKRR